MSRRAFRYWSVIGLLGLFALLILIKYAGLAIGSPAGAAAGAVEVERGPIMDRSGRVLALDSPLYNVAVWRPETVVETFPAEAKRLATILGMDETELQGRWKTEKADFFYLRKRVQPQIARAIQEGRAAGSFSGIVVEKVSGRLYPEKRLASHLVGFVGDANKGLAGVEARYDEDLSAGAKGQAEARGKAEAGAPVRGDSVSLSIDSDIQFSLEEVARKAMTDTGAQAVMLVAADARTGEILAYVALPDFDPNEYLLAPAEAWYDWPSVYAYEPGSVFKVFSMASVLDLGGATTRSTFVCDGAYHRTAPSGEPITIKCLAVHGTVDIEHILEYSCNAGAGYASDTVQALDFYERLRGFGFGSRLGLALAGESPGQLRSPETWSLRSKPTIAMGQEVLVTALQMTAAATAIANGGVVLKPIIVKRVAGPDGTTVYENAPQAVRRAVSAETASAILASMETVSSESGTGRRAKVKDVRMAVKTGTAQMIDPQTRRYSEKDYIASTLAIFPADEPRVVLYLAIVKPTGESYFGGRIAAPVIKDAAEAVLSLTDLPRGASPSVLHPGVVTIPKPEAVSVGQVMPDLTGTPKRLLLPLLVRKDILVHISGEGYVVGQKPAPGSPVAPGTEIFLELK
ncbi:MAG TPA: penicillin-binding protein [Rectinemataceae bacterium]|nr:penicillin-binding protein [Rectinemataceae bacterium]